MLEKTLFPGGSAWVFGVQVDPVAEDIQGFVEIQVAGGVLFLAVFIRVQPQQFVLLVLELLLGQILFPADFEVELDGFPVADAAEGIDVVPEQFEIGAFGDAGLSPGAQNGDQRREPGIVNRIGRALDGIPFQRMIEFVLADLHRIGERGEDDIGRNTFELGGRSLKELECANKEIYRVGGDEFLIITPNTSKEDFDLFKVQLIKNSERPGRAHFAMGACHSSEYGDVRRAMQIADARMYDVKEEYYSRHPEYEWHNKPV